MTDQSTPCSLPWERRCDLGERMCVRENGCERVCERELEDVH